MLNGITIYRGSHQIGGCVTEIKTHSHRIIIDFGSNLPGCENKSTITDSQLQKIVFNGKPCDGVLFTHYHSDHIGLYKQIPANIPLYIGPTAKKILQTLTEKLDKHCDSDNKGLTRVNSMNTYYPSKKIQFGDIIVTPFTVDHSAIDSYMFLIDVGGKKIIHTGDFRDHGIAGERGTLEKVINSYIGEVNILLTEATLISRRDEVKWNPIQSEEDLGRFARNIFNKSRQHHGILSRSSMGNGFCMRCLSSQVDSNCNGR